MLLRRLKEFGLDTLVLSKDKEFQQKMGKELRKLVFDYMEGELKLPPRPGRPKISDGPELLWLRENPYLNFRLNESKGFTLDSAQSKKDPLSVFISRQKPDGAWASEIELTLLSELLNVNCEVKYPTNTKFMSLPQKKDVNRPTVALLNTGNASWDAILDGNKDTTTIHDGNCGYHAFANSIKHLVEKELRAEAALASRQETKISSQHVTTTSHLQQTLSNKGAVAVGQLSATAANLKGPDIDASPLETKEVRNAGETLDTVQNSIPLSNILTDELKGKALDAQFKLENRIKKEANFSSPLNSMDESKDYKTIFRNYNETKKKQVEEDYKYALTLAAADCEKIENSLEEADCTKILSQSAANRGNKL